MSTKTTIDLGTASRLTPLYSYPNFPGDKRSLAQTIEHWFGMTLVRDGLAGATATVRVQGSEYFLDLAGADALASSFALYARRLPQFLKNGEDALNNVVPQLKQQNKWDPCPDKSAGSYHPWRFFLPHGMAMLNQKALLFFHYPPIRLLDVNQDYLDDPVPVRCEELLAANGVTSASPDNLATGDIMLFNTVMDATPIGAEDDQGSKNPVQCKADGCPATAYDPTFGLIPIQYFHDYQKAQVQLLLNVSPNKKGFTVPIVVYGAHPLQTFNDLYGCKLKNYAPAVVEIIPGLKTPVLASSHPYVFYGEAQGFDKIGSGVMPASNVKAATAQMQADLAVAGWLKAMSDDPSQDVAAVWKAMQGKWSSAQQLATVSALARHQGSLFYSDPKTLTFTFKTPLNLPSAPASAPTPVLAASPKAKSAPASSAKGGLQVIGDNGQTVDWWFIYKVASGSAKGATGQEYIYFDSEMAKNPNAKPALSKNKIDTGGALHDTLSQIFTPAAKANKDLGWFCYNDEDRTQLNKKTGKQEGVGEGNFGHCKGALAFDLGSNSAFWLVHSVPLMPMNAQFAYRPGELAKAQTLLCIQLADATSTSLNIAALMFKAHGPNVNVASDMLTTAKDPANNITKPPVTNVPKTLGTTDPRVQLMQNKNGSMVKPVPTFDRVPFLSKGGQQFTAIAKNKAWGNPKLDPDVKKSGPKDFYNDLVASVLDEALEVETWEDAKGKIPPPTENGEKHPVENTSNVNLKALGLPYAWTEEDDHAKLAISDRGNPAQLPKYVCVGDINFTDAQDQRGGGTVAFVCTQLWSALASVLVEGTPKDETPHGKPSAKPATPPPAKPKPAPAAPAGKPSVKNTTAAKKIAASKAAKKATATKPPVKKKPAAAKKSAVGRKPAAPKKPATKKSPAVAAKKKSTARRPAVKR